MVTAAPACCWCGSCLCVTAWQKLWRLCALVTCFIVKMGRRWLQNQSVMFEEMKDASSQVLRASAVPCRERIPLYRVLTYQRASCLGSCLIRHCQLLRNLRRRYGQKHTKGPRRWSAEQAAFKRRREVTSNDILMTGSVCLCVRWSYQSSRCTEGPWYMYILKWKLCSNRMKSRRR